MIDEYYKVLRGLISDNYKIVIRDGREPEIAIVPDSHESFPWTHFKGKTLEDAFERAIDKFRNPDKDYRDIPSVIDREGCLWKANEESVYSAQHTRIFLKKNGEGE